ncbi:MAG: aldehyde dehydrogenase family protein [Mycobacterium sp.]
MTAGTALDTAALDKALNDLHFSAPDWAALSLAEKVAMLEALPRKVLDLAPQMVAAAADAKGIAPTSTWTAEEWSVGVWVFIQAVNTQLLVLKRILAGREPIDGNAVHTRPDGQVVVDVFPLTGYDRLFLNGYRAAVWLEPNVSAEQARNDAAIAYRGPTRGPAEVCLVLAAGNVIDQLYVRGNVCAVKMHPVNDYLGPFYDQIFSEFISRGWLRFLYGGADAGAYLAHHRKVDTIHMTGSAATYDAIVWGTDDRAAARRADNTPLLDKPISAELGGISPFIVVPGTGPTPT